MNNLMNKIKNFIKKDTEELNKTTPSDPKKYGKSLDPWSFTSKDGDRILKVDKNPDDKDKWDWETYKKCHTYYNSDEDKTLKSSYKAPHHKIDPEDGQLKVYKRGVIAAKAAYSGARGGIDIPEEDKIKGLSHLNNHLEKDFEVDIEEMDKIMAKWIKKNKNSEQIADLVDVEMKNELLAKVVANLQNDETKTDNSLLKKCLDNLDPQTPKNDLLSLCLNKILDEEISLEELENIIMAELRKYFKIPDNYDTRKYVWLVSTYSKYIICQYSDEYGKDTYYKLDYDYDSGKVVLTNKIEVEKKFLPKETLEKIEQIEAENQNPYFFKFEKYQEFSPIYGGKRKELGIIYGTFLPCNEVDGSFNEDCVDKEEVRKAAHGAMMNLKKGKFSIKGGLPGTAHKKVADADLVESYIDPYSGNWKGAVQINDENIKKEARSGNILGFSFGGTGQGIEIK